MAFRRQAGLKNITESAMNQSYFLVLEAETNLTILRLTVISKIVMERGHANFLKLEFFNR